MHGVIFNSFTDFVSTHFGSARAGELLADEPAYLMSEAYEDEAFARLLEKTAAATGVEAKELLHAFGVFAAEHTFARLYPAFYAVAGSARSFLLTVEERIHELVRATIPDATPPQLRVEPLGADSVRITYTSERRLCVLLCGLVEGTARHYGETSAIEEPACMRRGDPACHFEVRFSPLARVA